MRPRLLSGLLLLGLLPGLVACTAAPPPTPCQRQCGRVYDSCMDVGGSISNPQAMRAVEAQCTAAQTACIRACERPE